MRVAVLGCGYVGLELAGQLLERGHEVVGVRRSDEGLEAVDAAGAEAVRADVTDPGTLESVPAVDALVFSASAGGRDAEAARRTYVDGLRGAIQGFASRDEPPERLVYTSSTAVYGDRDGAWVDEETPLEPATDRERALVDAERVALETAPSAGIDPTVVRFGGLYGPGRYRLERYLDGPVTSGYRNLIHREDAAGVVRFVLESAAESLLVAVDDEPVDRWAFADWLADACRVDRPEKRTQSEFRSSSNGRVSRRVLASKRCSNERLRGLGYSFTYPTFREGFRPAVRAFRQRGH